MILYKGILKNIKSNERGKNEIQIHMLQQMHNMQESQDLAG